MSGGDTNSSLKNRNGDVDRTDETGEVGGGVTINIRCSNGSKFSVQASLESSVESFKSIISQNCDIPPEQQQLIYKGQILKGDQTLQFYGTIGHVAHGKSTVVKAISGVQTVRFKSELERNITMKLGYANAKIYKCEDEMCPRPLCYKAYGSGTEDNPMCDVPGFEHCRMKLLRYVSFVDCPGHDLFMTTMLAGAAIMDGALLLIAANETCPQPQTKEHLLAIDLMHLRHIIIIQNKVDLVHESVAINQHEAIQKLIKDYIPEGAPVIPISAQLKYNIDVAPPTEIAGNDM